MLGPDRISLSSPQTKIPYVTVASHHVSGVADAYMGSAVATCHSLKLNCPCLHKCDTFY